MTSFCMRCVAGRGQSQVHIPSRATDRTEHVLVLPLATPGKMAQESLDLLFLHLTKVVFQGPSCSAVEC